MARQHVGRYALVAALALAGCQQQEAEPSSPVPTAIVSGGVTIRVREGPSPPPGCTPGEVAKLIAFALDALSSGDQERLARAFYDNPVFSMDTRPRGTFFVLSGGQRELLAYFVERYRHGEVTRLVQLDVTFSDRRAQFGLLVSREADDGTGVAPGKGELDCGSQRIFIWNIGQAAP